MAAVIATSIRSDRGSEDIGASRDGAESSCRGQGLARQPSVLPCREWSHFHTPTCHRSREGMADRMVFVRAVLIGQHRRLECRAVVVSVECPDGIPVLLVYPVAVQIDVERMLKVTGGTECGKRRDGIIEVPYGDSELALYVAH